MMRCAMLTFALLLVACNERQPAEQTYTKAELDARVAQAIATERKSSATVDEPVALRSEVRSSNIKPRREATSAKVEDDAPMDDIAEDTQAEADLCWQDYCPCEPPQGGPDQGLCRQLRAGMDVDPQMLAAAAMMRDARKQMDDFKAENPGF